MATPEEVRPRRRRVWGACGICVGVAALGWGSLRVGAPRVDLAERLSSEGVVVAGRHRVPLLRLDEFVSHIVVTDVVSVAAGQAAVERVRAVVERSWWLRQSVRECVWTWSAGSGETGGVRAVAWVGWRDWVIRRALGDIPGGVAAVDGALYFEVGGLPARYAEGVLSIGQATSDEGGRLILPRDDGDDVVLISPNEQQRHRMSLDLSHPDRLVVTALDVHEQGQAAVGDPRPLAAWLGDWPAGVWMFPSRSAGVELGQWLDGRGTNAFFEAVLDHDGPSALVLGAGPSAASQFMFDTPSVSVVFQVSNRKRSILHAERFFQRIDARGGLRLLRKEVSHAEARLIGYQATKQGFLQFRDEDRFAYGVNDRVLVIGNSLKVVRQLLARTWPTEEARVPVWYANQTSGEGGSEECMWLDAPALAKAGHSMVSAMRVANVIEASPEYEGVINAWERFFRVFSGWEVVEGQRTAGWEITIRAARE